MRTLRLLILPAAAIIAVAGCTPYRGGRYSVSASYGPGVDIYGYYPDYWGDWRNSYSMWTPTLVYEYGGRYYPTAIRGGRPVSVYQYRNQYFVPPRDRNLERTDRRLDSRHRPNNSDYQRARPRPAGRGPGGR